MKTLVLFSLLVAYAFAQRSVSQNPIAPRVVESLNNIDYANILGAPLLAAVEAQAKASASTVQFIQGVGFNRDPVTNRTSVHNMVFEYSEFNNGSETNRFAMSIPILTLVQVPALEVEFVEIQFNARITQTQSTVESFNSSNSQNYDYSSYGGYWASPSWYNSPLYWYYWGSSSRFSGSVSSQSSSRIEGNTVESYDLNIRMRAAQAPQAPGVVKMFDLLEKLIREADPAPA